MQGEPDDAAGGGGRGAGHTRAREHPPRGAAPAGRGARHERAPPGRHAPRAPLRPRLRRRDREQRRRAAPRAVGGALRHGRRLPHGLLRHLVGVDELHVVRLGLRQRRRRVPAAHLRHHVRRPLPRRGGARPVRRRLVGHRRDGLRGHALRDGGAVAARRRRPPRAAADRPLVRGRHRRRAAAVDRAALGPRGVVGAHLPPARRRRAARPGARRAQPRVHPVPPAPHRRALRPPRDHRPRGGDPLLGPGGAGGHGRARGPRGVGRPRRALRGRAGRRCRSPRRRDGTPRPRRAAHRLRAVVDLLLAGPRPSHRGGRALGVGVRVRPLPRLRGDRRGGLGHRGRGRRRAGRCRGRDPCGGAGPGDLPRCRRPHAVGPPRPRRPRVGAHDGAGRRRHARLPPRRPARAVDGDGRPPHGPGALGPRRPTRLVDARRAAGAAR